MKNFKEMQFFENDISKHKKYCKCGHSIIFPDNSKARRVLCTHCGHYIYKNKQDEFKDRLLTSMLKSN